MFFPEAHDLLKLVYKGGKSPHYCPNSLKDLFPQYADAILKRQLLELHHHCFVAARKGHACSPFYPLDGRWLLLSVADWKAAAISRRLVKGLLSGGRSKAWRSYRIVKVWKTVACEAKPTDSGGEIVEALARKDTLDEILKTHKQEMTTRSEDINRPFASLWTHSQLTKWWFDFLNANQDYFGVPATIKSLKEAKSFLSKVEKTPFYFIRYAIVPNERLSRMVDRMVFHQVPELHRELVASLPGARALYQLGFEQVVVVCPPDSITEATQEFEFTNWLKDRLSIVSTFSTNYRIELTASPAALNRFRLMYPFNTLFERYQIAVYPNLLDVIQPSTDDVEAANAILCELCQLAPAAKTLEKPTWREQVRTTEHLCTRCVSLRQRQNEEALGRDYAHWEDDPDAHATYVYIDLSMPQLWKKLGKDISAQFRLAKIPSDEDLGFSPIKEFLTDFTSFLQAFVGQVFSLDKYKDENLKNRIQILDNLLCLKMEQSAEIRQVMDIYVRLINQFFGLWHDDLPIFLSICFGRVKFPFYEYWQQLKRTKERSINIYKLRSAILEIQFDTWKTLTSLSLEHRSVSSFLHRLAVLEERTGGSRLILDTEVLENRRLFGKAFSAFVTQKLTAQDILAFYKIFRQKPR